MKSSHLPVFKRLAHLYSCAMASVLLALPCHGASLFDAYELQAQGIVSQMNQDEKVGQMLLPIFNLLTDELGPNQEAIAEQFWGSLTATNHEIGVACGFQAIYDLHLAAVLQAAGPISYSKQDQSLPQWQKLSIIANDFFNPPPGYPTGAGATHGIPKLLLGNDAVHGNQHVPGAVIFPHNIGMGATHNPSLVGTAGQWTKRTVLNAYFNWAYAPCVTIGHDCRWGRFYESFGADSAVVKEFANRFITGLQQVSGGTVMGMLGTVKHFVGDGNTQAGVDEGYMISPSLNETWASNGAGYEGAVDANVGSCMPSFHSLNGVPMHFGGAFNMVNLFRNTGITGTGNTLYQLGGFMVSDYSGVGKAAAKYNALHGGTLSLVDQVAMSINAGVDMLMIAPGDNVNPLDYAQAPPYPNLTPLNYSSILEVRNAIKQAVEQGLISQSRIDDAALRILRTKIAMNIDPANAEPLTNPELLQQQSDALEMATQSMVLLKDPEALLPIDPIPITNVFLMGDYDDIGSQCGGWTINWQGQKGNGYWPVNSATRTSSGATTILTGVQSILPSATYYLGEEAVITGSYAGVTAANSVAIIALSEYPYAEFCGDVANQNPYYTLGALQGLNQYITSHQPQLVEVQYSSRQLQAIFKLKSLGIKVITVLFSGRTTLINQGSNSPLTTSDAFVAAFLPGTTGGRAFANLIFGVVGFKATSNVINGKTYYSNTLPFPWPASMIEIEQARGTLFPIEFGLQTAPL